MNSDELLLCDLQANIFEYSLNMGESSSIFIRRFMNSNVAKRFDNMSILNESDDYKKIIKEINNEYKNKSYGSSKFGLEEISWIGYIYRYWNILYKTPSKKIYKICNSTEMRNLYYIYHTLDPKKAIDRILESKNISIETDLIERGVNILRKIKKEKLTI